MATGARALDIHDPYIEDLVERVCSLRGEDVAPTVPPNGVAIGDP